MLFLWGKTSANWTMIMIVNNLTEKDSEKRNGRDDERWV